MSGHLLSPSPGGPAVPAGSEGLTPAGGLGLSSAMEREGPGLRVGRGEEEGWGEEEGGAERGEEEGQRVRN